MNTARVIQEEEYYYSDTGYAQSPIQQASVIEGHFYYDKENLVKEMAIRRINKTLGGLLAICVIVAFVSYYFADDFAAVGERVVHHPGAGNRISFFCHIVFMLVQNLRQSYDNLSQWQRNACDTCAFSCARPFGFRILCGDAFSFPGRYFTSHSNLIYYL